MALGGGGSPVKPRVANAGDNTVLHGMAGVVADQSLLELAAAGQCVVHNNNTNNNESTQGANTPPRRKCQPKIMRDSNPDFWINLDLDLDVYRIAPKMLWIHCLVGVSHFVKFRKNRPVTI